MHQIIPNLWLGNALAAHDKELLDRHNIKYRLSVLKGKVTVFPVC
jgi:NADPH-dependent glutamate synthase beta subunit-like oxidoreductase